MLMNAEQFFSVTSFLADPNIPLTVFTKNIDTILTKKRKKKTPLPVLEFVLPPASSLTGQTSRMSKTSVAWQVPLQHKDVSYLFTSNKVRDRSAPPQLASPAAQSTFSRREIVQQQRISSLEAQNSRIGYSKCINPVILGHFVSHGHSGLQNLLGQTA